MPASTFCFLLCTRGTVGDTAPKGAGRFFGASVASISRCRGGGRVRRWPGLVRKATIVPVSVYA